MNGATAPEFSENFPLELRMSEIQASEKTGEKSNLLARKFF